MSGKRSNGGNPADRGGTDTIPYGTSSSFGGFPGSRPEGYKPQIYQEPPAPPPPPPPPPTAENSAAALEAAAAEERKKARSRSATILTSGQGLLDEPSLSRKTLI